MDSLEYQSVMLAKLEDSNKVRLAILDYLLAHKKKVQKSIQQIYLIREFSARDLVWKAILSIGYKDLKFGK